MLKFSKKQYIENLNYIEALFTLGGLSECGKTSAGEYFDTIGIKRKKIIQIEREMMEERGWDLTDGMKEEYFCRLYKSQEKAFREFLYRLVEYMKIEKTTKISIESLYRAPLGSFLKRELKDRCCNIYIEAPIEVRASREMLKINKKAIKDGLPKVTLEEVLDKVKNKDIFKEKHHANDCRNIADYVVYNGADVTYEEFLREIDDIAQCNLNKIHDISINTNPKRDLKIESIINNSNLKQKIFGSKANNIILMQENGINVPKTWIISYEYPIKLLIDELGIDIRIKSNRLDYEKIYNFFDDIPLNIYNEVLGEIEKLKRDNESIKRFAVRSSHSCEDGDLFSFPGIFTTYLNLSNSINITNSIFKCWKDCFSSAVEGYSRMIGINAMYPCSIIIQEFIISVSSGVIFKDNDKIYINSTFGMAKSIVDGTTGFDTWIIDAKTKRFIDYNNSKNIINLPIITKSNPREGDLVPFLLDDKNLVKVLSNKNTDTYIIAELNDNLKNTVSLTDAKINELISTCAEVSKKLSIINYDIEWAYKNDTLYILQCRNLTRAINTIMPDSKLKVLPLVSGKATGVTFRVNTEEEAKMFREGGILVSKNLNGPVLLAANKACGCILESRSPLSHSAIIARELGIPAVGAVDLSEIEIGNNYFIDGENGIIMKSTEVICREKNKVSEMSKLDKKSVEFVNYLSDFETDIKNVLSK